MGCWLKVMARRGHWGHWIDREMTSVHHALTRYKRKSAAKGQHSKSLKELQTTLLDALKSAIVQLEDIFDTVEYQKGEITAITEAASIVEAPLPEILKGTRSLPMRQSESEGEEGDEGSA